MKRGQAAYTPAEEKTASAQTVEAIKLLSDFAKWLITIETTAIAALGYVFTIRDPFAYLFTRFLACAAVLCFTGSILSATLLLRSLPGILQRIKPAENLWRAKGVQGMPTKFSTAALVQFETTLFTIGVVLTACILVAKILSR